MSAQDRDAAADERFAELLRRVVEEGLDPRSQAARELLEDHMQEDMDIARRVADSQAVIGLLERSARQQRSDLGAATGPVEARHTALVQRFVAERTQPPRANRRWGLALAALAAAAALILWLRTGTGREPAGPEIHLGGDFAVRATPDGLAWDYTLSPGGWFSVVAREANAPDAPDAPGLARAARLSSPFWPLDAEARVRWPAGAVLEITAYDGTGQVEIVQRATLP